MKDFLRNGLLTSGIPQGLSKGEFLFPSVFLYTEFLLVFKLKELKVAL